MWVVTLQIAMFLRIAVLEGLDIDLVDRTLLPPLLWLGARTLGGQDDDDHSSHQHANPDEPEEDEEEPPESHPERVLGVLHQLSLGQGRKGVSAGSSLDRHVTHLQIGIVVPLDHLGLVVAGGQWLALGRRPFLHLGGSFIGCHVSSVVGRCLLRFFIVTGLLSHVARET